MKNIWTIAKREYKLYFSSPIAYAVAFLILSIISLIFVLNLWAILSDPYSAYNTPPNAQMVTSPIAFLLVLSTPALTMRLFADEIRMGTMELLLTAPVRDHELAIGKWLGSFLFVLTLLAVSLVFPFILNLMIDPGIDQVLMLSGYLGVILLASAFLGLGVGISSLFSNQIAAFFTTIVLLVIMWWLIGAPANFMSSGGDVFRYLDMSGHFYNNLNQGLITPGDIVYYLSVTALGLFVATTAIEIRRWR
jgi:ABC-2 type transport system permease protein